MKTEKGFTLIELLIIIIILGFLTALISGNYITSLQKGRDAKRKNDLSQTQRALEAYYEDFKVYPSAAPPFGARFCSSPSCIASDKTYMVRAPSDPNSTYSYTYIVDPNGQYYYLLSCIENDKNDKGPGVSNGGYCQGPEPTPCGSAPTCGACGVCKFIMSSSNATPITPMPTIP